MPRDIEALVIIAEDPLRKEFPWCFVTSLV